MGWRDAEVGRIEPPKHCLLCFEAYYSGYGEAELYHYIPEEEDEEDGRIPPPEAER